MHWVGTIAPGYCSDYKPSCMYVAPSAGKKKRKEARKVVETARRRMARVDVMRQFDGCSGAVVSQPVDWWRAGLFSESTCDRSTDKLVAVRLPVLSASTWWTWSPSRVIEPRPLSSRWRQQIVWHSLREEWIVRVWSSTPSTVNKASRQLLLKTCEDGWKDGSWVRWCG